MITVERAVKVSEVVLSVDMLVEEIDMLIWEKGIENFKVIEDFGKFGEKELTVYGLTCEVERNDAMEVLMFSDAEDKLISNGFVSSMVLLDQIGGISKHTTEDKIIYYIDLCKGTILISINK